MTIFPLLANFKCKDEVKTDLFTTIYRSLFVFFKIPTKYKNEALSYAIMSLPKFLLAKYSITVMLPVFFTLTSVVPGPSYWRGQPGQDNLSSPTLNSVAVKKCS
jgi:hypothetical protein